MQQLRDVEKRIKHIEKRMEMLQERLDVLELQIDAKGEIDVEPYRIAERDKLRREISELKVEKKNLESEKQKLATHQKEQSILPASPPSERLATILQPPSPASTSARSPNQQEKNMQHEATDKKYQQAVNRTAINQVVDIALPLLGVIVVFTLLIYAATVLPWAELLLISVALILILLAVLTYVGLQSRVISEASWFKFYIELLRHIPILGATLPTDLPTGDETKDTQPNQKLSS